MNTGTLMAARHGLAAVVLLTAPLEAQTQQTASGAQTFICMTLANGSTKVGIRFEKGRGRNEVAYEKEIKKQKCWQDFFAGTKCQMETVDWRNVYETRTVNISKAISADNCTTNLTYSVTPRYSNDRTYIPGTFTINWKQVTQGVQLNGNTGTTVELNGQDIGITLSSPELATRFAYAAKFLRDACDPTAATGF